MCNNNGNEEPHQTPYGCFPNYYNYQRLQDVCLPKEGIQTGPFGSQLHSSDYVSYGTPIITVEHLGENRIIHQNLPRVTEGDKIRLSKYVLYEGDIVFSRVGSVDRRAIVRRNEDGWLFSGRLLRVRPNKSELDPFFLSYLMGLESFKEYIRKIAVGATMPSLNTKILSEIPICYPDIRTQKAIAHILGTLDDKIELNRRMNETLESIARAIFTSWFIDFDPVRAKAEGRQPEGMDASTAALFPSEFETVEGQEIPKGWKISTIYDIAEVRYGQPYSSKNFNNNNIGYPLIRIRDLKTNKPTFFTTETIDNEVLVNPGDIIVGMDAEFRAHYWKGPISLLNQRLCIFIPKIGVSNFLIFESIKKHLNFFESSKVGTTVIHLGKSDIDTFNIVVPSKEIMTRFKEVTDQLIKKTIGNSLLNHTISETRDTLLPKLLSGELRIDNPEAFTGTPP